MTDNLTKMYKLPINHNSKMDPKKRGQVKKIKKQRSLSLPSLVGLEPIQRPGKEPEPDQHDSPTPSDQDDSPNDSDNTVCITAAITHNHDDSSSSLTDCSRFALQSSIDCSRVAKFASFATRSDHCRNTVAAYYRWINGPTTTDMRPLSENSSKVFNQTPSCRLIQFG